MTAVYENTPKMRIAPNQGLDDRHVKNSRYIGYEIEIKVAED